MCVVTVNDSCSRSIIFNDDEALGGKAGTAVGPMKFISIVADHALSLVTNDGAD